MFFEIVRWLSKQEAILSFVVTYGNCKSVSFIDENVKQEPKVNYLDHVPVPTTAQLDEPWSNGGLIWKEDTTLWFPCLSCQLVVGEALRADASQSGS